jgi:hypothetical protein
MTAKTDRREALRSVYMYTVENWAPHASEIEEGTGFDAKAVKSLLGTLTRKGIVVGTQVNGEGPKVYQSYFDPENDSEASAKGAAAFAAAFPEPVAETTTGRQGATGPRYTDAQIRAGIAARAEGLSWPEVAKKAGVKSPSYFSNVVRKIAGSDPKPAATVPSKARQAKLAAADRKAKKAPAKPAAKKSPAKKARKA